jgi:hypothetical protein
MAAKRKPQAPRAIPPRYPTGAAELAATAGDKYRVECDGPVIVDPILGPLIDGSQMMRGIRGPDGRFDARPGMTESQVYDEVAQLNAGLVPSKISQGIGRKPRYATEAVRWVEILLNVPETREKLLAARGGKLSADEVRGLMAYHDDRGGPDIRKAFPLPTAAERKRQAAMRPPISNARPQTKQALRQIEQLAEQQEAARQHEMEGAEEAERKLIEAVSKQLERYHGIGRKDGSRRNDWRTTKKAKR